MKFALIIAHISVSVLLVLVVMLQQQGSGLGATFGGDGNVFRTKRGIEKGLFYATIVLGTLFLAVGLANILIA